jgi:hypothetical protein
MKSWMLGAGGLLLVGAYIVFPYHATRELADALRSGDRALLERSIDLASVRASLRDELGVQLKSTAREVMGDDPFMEGLTDLLGGPALDSMADLYVTPAALGALIETGDFSLAALKGATEPATAKDFAIDFEEMRHAFFSDPTTFRVELPRSVLKLRLQSWWWQLVEVEARPEQTLGAPESAPLPDTQPE